VLAPQRRLDRQRLVAVGRLDPLPAERLDQPPVDPGWPLAVAGRLRRQVPPVGDPLRNLPTALYLLKHRFQVHRCCYYYLPEYRDSGV